MPARAARSRISVSKSKRVPLPEKLGVHAPRLPSPAARPTSQPASAADAGMERRYI